MSQDQDPIDATRRFEPVDPYNIPPEHAGAPTQGYEGYEGHQPGLGQQPYGAAEPQRPQGFRQRLTRLGPLKLAVLGTAGVIVLGGAAWGTTAALQSGGSSSNTAAAAAPATDQNQSPAPAAGPTTGGTGHGAKLGKTVRLKIAEAEAGTIWGIDPKGRQVTVTYDAKTKFGTKKNPLKPENLSPGLTIAVSGSRDGDKIAATSIVFVNPKDRGPAVPGTATPPPPAASPTDPASPVGGNA